MKAKCFLELPCKIKETEEEFIISFPHTDISQIKEVEVEIKENGKS